MFNQIQSEYEIARYNDESNPNARGWRLGARAINQLKPFVLSTTFEYNHTDPYLYIRETPYTTYSWRRDVLSNAPGDESSLLTLPLGFKYGPDTHSLWFRSQARFPNLATIALEAEWVQQGENRITSPYDEGPDAAASTSPTGTPTTLWQFGLHTDLRPLPFLDTAGGLIYSYQTKSGTADQHSLEWYLSVTLEGGRLLDYLQTPAPSKDTE
ncbi:MAG: hypothetical protein GW949_08625 [Spirochaetales bacterium]|nr:hypothetical protein [Spirochaetales bacterium]